MPSKPSNPEQGKAAEEEQIEQQAAEAKQAAGEQAAEAPQSDPEATPDKPKPARKRAPRKPAAEKSEEKPAKPARAKKAPTAKADVDESPAEEPPAKATSARSRRTAKPSGPPPVVRAQAKYVRSSARKARLVCDNIRGKSVSEAEAILAFAPRAVARDWSKLLKSAVANAEHNHELIGDELRVKEAYADEGPTLKRFIPRAHGRATPIHKRTSHLTITLTPKD